MTWYFLLVIMVVCFLAGRGLTPDLEDLIYIASDDAESSPESSATEKSTDETATADFADEAGLWKTFTRVKYE